jgi:hypothetical protein
VRTGYQPKALGLGGGTLTVTATVTNTGNVRQSGQVAVTAKGLLGVWDDSVLITLPDIIPPGQQVTVTQEIDGVPPAVWADVSLTLTPTTPPGLQARATAPAVSASRGVWLAPWVAGIGLVIIAGAVWLLVHLRRRSAAVKQELRRIRQQLAEKTSRSEAEESARAGKAEAEESKLAGKTEAEESARVEKTEAEEPAPPEPEAED